LTTIIERVESVSSIDFDSGDEVSVELVPVKSMNKNITIESDLERIANGESSDDEVIPVKSKITSRRMKLKNSTLDPIFETPANLENESPTMRIQRGQDYNTIFRNQQETIAKQEKLAEEKKAAAQKVLQDKIALEMRKKMFLTKEEMTMDPVFMAYKYEDFKQV